MVMPSIHARRRNRSNTILGQINCRQAQPLRLEAQEILIFFGTNEIAGNAPMARHRHGLALGEHAVSPEISRELGRRHCFLAIQRSPP